MPGLLLTSEHKAEREKSQRSEIKEKYRRAHLLSQSGKSHRRSKDNLRVLVFWINI